MVDPDITVFEVVGYKLHHATLAPVDTLLLARVDGVVVEETVQTSPEYGHITRIDYAQAPRHGAGRVGLAIRLADVRARHGKVWVLEVGNGREREVSWGVGLVVRCLRLDKTHVDIVSLVELVVIKYVVLASTGHDPYLASLALDQQTTAYKDSYFGLCRRFNIMIRDPKPAVFLVEAGCPRGDVHGHETRYALFLDVGLISNHIRSDGALFNLKLGTGKPADADVDFPHAARPVLTAGGVEVVLDHYGSSGPTNCPHKSFGPLNVAPLTLVANTHDWLRVRHVGEEWPCAQDKRRETFANNPRASRDVHG